MDAIQLIEEIIEVFDFPIPNDVRQQTEWSDDWGYELIDDDQQIPNYDHKEIEEYLQQRAIRRDQLSKSWRCSFCRAGTWFAFVIFAGQCNGSFIMF